MPLSSLFVWVEIFQGVVKEQYLFKTSSMMKAWVSGRHGKTDPCVIPENVVGEGLPRLSMGWSEYGKKMKETVKIEMQGEETSLSGLARNTKHLFSSLICRSRKHLLHGSTLLHWKWEINKCSPIPMDWVARSVSKPLKFSSPIFWTPHETFPSQMNIMKAFKPGGTPSIWVSFLLLFVVTSLIG